MPIYEFAYRLPTGETKVVERTFKMSDAPQSIFVDDNGVQHSAVRIISRTASMKNNWAAKGTASDLPDESAPYMGPKSEAA